MNGDLDIFDMNGDLDIFDMTRGSFRTAREPMRPSNAFCYFPPSSLRLTLLPSMHDLPDQFTNASSPSCPFSPACTNFLPSLQFFILCEENGMSILFSKESLTYYVVEVVGEGERWRAIKQV